MSLDTLNNGDSGLDARTKINAAITAVNAGRILRATGTLQTHTAAATQGVLILNVTTGISSGSSASIAITQNGVQYPVTVTNSDMEDWSASQLASAFAANASGAFTGSSDGNLLTLTSQYSASSQSLSFDGSDQVVVNLVSNTAGTDDSGGTQELVLASGVAGKKIKMIGAWFDGAVGGATVQLNIGGWPITDGLNASTYGTFAPSQNSISFWADGHTDGENLSAFLGGMLPTDGSTCTVSVIFEQS